jgi:HK97 family phage major capsid protein
MSKIGHANDAMIRRLQKELEERTAAAQGIVATAQDGERDLNDAESETLGGLRDRITKLQTQLGELEATADLADQVGARMKQFDQAITMARRNGETNTEYRSAGAWALDSYKASIGDRQARERLEMHYRVAAHQTTPDNLGVVPDPIVGNVINFIDAARPVASFLGPMPLTAATWHRPHVTQHTTVLPQGGAGEGGSDKEKVELTSQKMTITRIEANAVTYGGYVNVSRQNIDFSSPQVMDLIINDLAAQYAIQTEAAVGDELAATNTAAISYGSIPTAATVAAAIWEAAGVVYAATKGQGRLFLAVASDVLGIFGPLFAPVNPRDAQSEGFVAGRFGQGVMGTIGGIPVVMSAGVDAGEAYMLSSASLEVFEQRVGTLQVTEPSVLGVQVAYAGYFTALTIDDDGIVPLTGGESL